MAIARPSPLITSLSGPVGGIQFVTSKGGLRIRSRPCRRPTPTAPSMAARRDLRQVQNAWNAATEQVRLFWTNFARQLSRSDKLAQTFTPTPYSAFCEYSLYALRLFGGSTGSTPQPRVTDPPTAIDFADFDGGPYYLRVTHATTALTVKAALYALPIYSTRHPSTRPTLRYVLSLTCSSSFTNIYDEWTARLPALRANQPYFLGIRVMQADSYPSSLIVESRFGDPY